MPDYIDVFKHGWHPEKEGTTLKGQVKGVFSRDKSGGRNVNHVARPVSELRDPSTLPPPPRRGDPPSGLASGPQGLAAAAQSSNPTNRPEDVAPQHQAQQYQASETQQEPPISGPFRVDTTGLSTSHLPPPPVRTNGTNARATSPQTAIKPTGPPSLPPRLPPRNNSPSSPVNRTIPPSPQPSHHDASSGTLNPAAVSRLGAAGINVAGFGIGKQEAPPPSSSQSASQANLPPSAITSRMSELQSRFSNRGKPSEPSSSTQGTTWAQKQAAMQTASSFQKDPRSVSTSDAREAASTFNNFRQRHGDQVAASMKTANKVNEKHGITNRIGDYAGAGGARWEEGVTSARTGGVSTLAGKKPPPPPPARRKPILPGQGNTTTNPGDDPPPLPLSTKPQF